MVPVLPVCCLNISSKDLVNSCAFKIVNIFTCSACHMVCLKTRKLLYRFQNVKFSVKLSIMQPAR